MARLRPVPADAANSSPPTRCWRPATRSKRTTCARPKPRSTCSCAGDGRDRRRGQGPSRPPGSRAVRRRRAPRTPAAGARGPRPAPAAAPGGTAHRRRRGALDAGAPGDPDTSLPSCAGSAPAMPPHGGGVLQPPGRRCRTPLQGFSSPPLPARPACPNPSRTDHPAAQAAADALRVRDLHGRAAGRPSAPPLSSKSFFLFEPSAELLRGVLSCFTIAVICQASLSYNDLYDWKTAQNRAELGNRLVHSCGTLVMLAFLVLVAPSLFFFPGIDDVSGETWKLIWSASPSRASTASATRSTGSSTSGASATLRARDGAGAPASAHAHRRAQRVAGGDRAAGQRLHAALGQRGVHSAAAGRDVELCAVAGGGAAAALAHSARARGGSAADRGLCGGLGSMLYSLSDDADRAGRIAARRRAEAARVGARRPRRARGPDRQDAAGGGEARAGGRGRRGGGAGGQPRA